MLKKLFPTLFTVSAVFLVLACSSTKNFSGEGIVQIDYQVQESRIIADSIWEKLHKMKPGSNKRSKAAHLKKLEHPEPSFYRVWIKETGSRTKYTKALHRGEEGNIVRHSTPFTSKNGYKFIDSTGIYIDFSTIKPGAYLKIPDKEFRWQKTNRDSIIHGIDLKLMKGQNKNARIKAWVTSKFNPNLGVYAVYNPEGFVLAYEMTTKNHLIFKKETIKVIPKKIRKVNKNFGPPEFKKEYSREEIKQFYRKRPTNNP